jgi:hypothetical protein
VANPYSATTIKDAIYTVQKIVYYQGKIEGVSRNHAIIGQGYSIIGNEHTALVLRKMS